MSTELVCVCGQVFPPRTNKHERQALDRHMKSCEPYQEQAHLVREGKIDHEREIKVEMLELYGFTETQADGLLRLLDGEI